MTALQSEERADLALLAVSADVVGAEGERESVRVFRYESARDVDLLELNPRISGVAVFAGRVNGPELCSDHPFLESIEIRVTWSTLAEIVGIDISAGYRIFANSPGQIVVSIYERSLAENPFCPSEIHIVGRPWRCLGVEWNKAAGKHQKAEPIHQRWARVQLISKKED